VPHDVVVLPVEGLDHVASPVALEVALVRTAGVGSVSMNVAAGRVRIAFDPDRYLPSRIRSGELLDAIVKAGYRLSRDAVMVSEVPAVYVAAAAHRTSRRRVLSAR